MAQHGLGWIPQLPDHRDHALRIGAPIELPTSIDLRNYMPPIGDQGQLGSCTAWAATAAYRYEMLRQSLPDFEPSELAEYYWTRALEGTTKVDAGASIRDSIKVLAKVGAVPCDRWPYDISKFAKRPSAAVRRAAKLHLAIEYQSVPQGSLSVKTALSDGLPVVFGISVYESFESQEASRTGVIPIPDARDQLLGGHAIVLVGYDDASRRFTFRNSWGTGWGESGYGYLPYPYVLSPSLASDFWVIRSVT